MIEIAGHTSIVIPAFNEGASVGHLVTHLRGVADWHEILVVDDGSTDGTGAEAAAAGARVLTHPYNKGNGAAVKTGIRQASGTFVLIVDADGQHRPADAMRLVSQLATFELVVGARSNETRRRPGRGASATAALNAIASYLTGRPIPDLTSGFRAARRDCLLEFLHLSRTDSRRRPRRRWPSSRRATACSSSRSRPRSRQGASKIRLGADGARFFLILLKVITIFSPLRIFVPVSLLTFAVGAAYAVWTIATQSHVTNSSVLLILLSVVMFLIGLVSEQIASLQI